MKQIWITLVIWVDQIPAEQYDSEVQMNQQEPVSFIHYEVTATLLSLYVLSLSYLQNMGQWYNAHSRQDVLI